MLSFCDFSCSDDDFERPGPRQDCLGGLFEMDWDADGAGAVISNRRSSPDTQELTTGAQRRRCSTWECSTILATPVTALLPHHTAARLSGKQRVRTAVWKMRQLTSAAMSFSLMPG